VSGQALAVVRDGGRVEAGKVLKLYGFQGLKRVEIADAGPGELVSVAGIEAVSIGDTLADAELPVPLCPASAWTSRR
jgi:GTP-binding protein